MAVISLKAPYYTGKEEARSDRGAADQIQPKLQPYMDYMMVDSPQSSHLMQRLEPYTYQKYAYQDEEGRSLNLVDGDMSSIHSRGSGHRPHPLNKDTQLLQDLVSVLLSSPAQPTSHHQVATPLSTPPFFQGLNFPLDYSKGYISQVMKVSSQQHKKKTPKEHGKIAGLDGSVQKSLNDLQGGFDLSHLDTEDKGHLFAVLSHLDPEDMRRLFSVLDLLQSEPAMALRQGSQAPQKLVKMTEGATTQAEDKTPVSGRPGPSRPRVIAGGASVLGPAALMKQDEGWNRTPKPIPAKNQTKQKDEYEYLLTNQSVVGPTLTLRVHPNSQNLSTTELAEKAAAEKTFLEQETGLDVLQTGVGEKSDGLPVAIRVQHSTGWVFFIFVGVACVGGLLVGSLTIACLRSHAHQLASGKLALGPETGSSTQSVYQDLCRQHMATKSSGKQESGAGATGVGGVRGGAVGGAGGGVGTDTSRVSSVSSQFSDANQPSPSSHSSTPSWGEEPAQSNMDISTGHMILAYMEDHVKNKDRLLKEWEALCSYQAEFSTVLIAQSEGNTKKNRCSQSVPYDHSRVKLKAEVNPSRADYINASTIIEHDPRMPAYIATQGPLSHTISDFWQMVWENGCTVIVMMTALVEDGEKQCDRYWPDEGSSLYHIYEVNLVSEHIWCNDFLVRSFYVKNVQTQETRTLTQFHFLSWPAQGIPTSTRPLLDFRRKVNKCYRGRSCPIIVHCSDGTGRTGTYILIDMVLNRMTKGVKEIDIAATLEHIRDQRPGMVCSKDQFEFALTAVAEEVNAILKALPQ
ncbi:receptor-type tyrosine-protein phosphatase-like N isoform X2 [Electrophorus electricus]|uniref:receptor-type tyrosine-protein phosphatase-like N isoform X2 n=1 Tax=Electrophorus electricus TaxID=8005 RepID=UPI0015D0945E|nr:receptor-type tyrosine-protein phosphatase-like N isoform X2 [Electrophorus electricus]